MARLTDEQRLAETQAYADQKMAQFRAVFGNDPVVVLLPSNAAAGPCEASCVLANTGRFSADRPLTLPLPGCDRGIQCACLLSVRLSFED